MAEPDIQIAPIVSCCAVLVLFGYKLNTVSAGGIAIKVNSIAVSITFCFSIANSTKSGAGVITVLFS